MMPVARQKLLLGDVELADGARELRAYGVRARSVLRLVLGSAAFHDPTPQTTDDVMEVVVVAHRHRASLDPLSAVLVIILEGCLSVDRMAAVNRGAQSCLCERSAPSASSAARSRTNRPRSSVGELGERKKVAV